MSTENHTTEQEQAVAGLRSLADLVEGGTVPVPNNIRAQFSGTPEEVERTAAVNGTDCERGTYEGTETFTVRIVVGKVGLHAIEYIAYASEPIEVERVDDPHVDPDHGDWRVDDDPEGRGDQAHDAAIDEEVERRTDEALGCRA